MVSHLEKHQKLAFNLDKKANGPSRLAHVDFTHVRDLNTF